MAAAIRGDVRAVVAMGDGGDDGANDGGVRRTMVCGAMVRQRGQSWRSTMNNVVLVVMVVR